MNDKKSREQNDPYAGHWEPYVEYSKTLRAWFISYGIGAPVLFMAQDGLAKKVSESEDINCIVLLFLLGVSAQVFVTLLNKWTNWVIYAHKTASSNKWWVKLADYISELFWLDLVVDIATLVMFVYGTFLTLEAVL
jgi:hypothetical protein